jgi:hypothetical protein
MDHFYSDILLGEPVKVAYDYQLIPFVKVNLIAKEPFIGITLIPVGLILISKKGIHYSFWS